MGGYLSGENRGGKDKEKTTPGQLSRKPRGVVIYYAFLLIKFGLLSPPRNFWHNLIHVYSVFVFHGKVKQGIQEGIRKIMGL